MLLGRTPFLLPLCCGHECVADVLSVGEQVKNVRPGQRVLVPFQINCGECATCQLGQTSNCTSVPPISMYGFGVGGGHWGGALAEQLAVPFADGMLVPLPDGVDPAAAASAADNLADAYSHIAPHLPDLLKRDPDTHVRIIVASNARSPYSASVPLYTGMISRALGARHVHLIDARAHVREQAEQLGMEAHTPAEGRRLNPAALVIDAGASPASLRAAIHATAPEGLCRSSGMLHRLSGIPVGAMYGRNITLRVGRVHARAVIPGLLEMIASGRLHPERVITNVVPFDEAPQGLAEHIHSDATKTVFTRAS
jgi:alcohol dehydrogenase